MKNLIRKAQQSDVNAIHEMILELADFEKLKSEVKSNAADLQEILFSNQPKAFAIIAEHDGKPAGFAIYFYNYSTFLGKHGIFLEDLYVKSNARGQGLGKLLFEQLITICRDEKLGRLEWNVLEWNKSAITFYEGFGARCLDDWRQFRLTAF